MMQAAATSAATACCSPQNVINLALYFPGVNNYFQIIFAGVMRMCASRIGAEITFGGRSPA